MKDIVVSFPKPCSEPWEEMSPRGCNRHCASCDKIIHDLTAMTADEADALFDVDPEPCVRAKIRSDGSVMTNSPFGSRRVMAVAGASVALATAACQSMPGQYPAFGSIAGKVETSCWGAVVVATAEDGRVYRAKARNDGRYVLKYLPHGKYRLAYSLYNDEREFKSVGEAVVSAGTLSVPPIVPEDDCIIVGVMSRDTHQG